MSIASICWCSERYTSHCFGQLCNRSVKNSFFYSFLLQLYLEFHQKKIRFWSIVHFHVSTTVFNHLLQSSSIFAKDGFTSFRQWCRLRLLKFSTSSQKRLLAALAELARSHHLSWRGIVYSVHFCHRRTDRRTCAVILQRMLWFAANVRIAQLRRQISMTPSMLW